MFYYRVVYYYSRIFQILLPHHVTILFFLFTIYSLSFILFFYHFPHFYIHFALFITYRSHSRNGYRQRKWIRLFGFNLNEAVCVTYSYADACRNTFNTIRTSGHSSLEKYTSHFTRKGSKGSRKVLCVRGELETEQNCNILTPQLFWL